jgi:hypothetical protein
MMGRKPIVGIFSVGLEEPYRWKDSVQTAAEIRRWALAGLANGLPQEFRKFAGSVNDPRWRKPVEELYTWSAANQRYLRHERPLARVAIVHSHQSMWFHAADGARAKMDDAADGWHQALVEARVLFEMMHRPALRRGAPRGVQDADFAEHRGAARRAVRAVVGVRRAWWRDRGDFGDVALRRVGR